MTCPCNPPPFSFPDDDPFGSQQGCCGCYPPRRCCGDVVISFACVTNCCEWCSACPPSYDVTFSGVDSSGCIDCDYYNDTFNLVADPFSCSFGITVTPNGGMDACSQSNVGISIIILETEVQVNIGNIAFYLIFSAPITQPFDCNDMSTLTFTLTDSSPSYELFFNCGDWSTVTVTIASGI